MTRPLDAAHTAAAVFFPPESVLERRIRQGDFGNTVSARRICVDCRLALSPNCAADTMRCGRCRAWRRREAKKRGAQS